MTISRDAGESYKIRSVDILGQNMRHRISFTKSNGIRDVFEADLAECIETILVRLPDGAHVFSDPDFVIELPGLTLARLRALINEAADGARQVIVRFRYFIGTLQSAFRVDTYLRVPSIDHREQIAVEALADIATPIFSLALAGARPPNSSQEYEHVRKKLEDLSSRASEVNFYLSLLTRYVTECARQTRENEELRARLESPRTGPHVRRLQAGS
ncbi:hypothetical protein [Amaricoccus macauensis]|uniref:hypothetical protein n=1 Tax=Amaricoccus macauensis TaxID=57001 RepID=UPI003C7DFE80